MVTVARVQHDRRPARRRRLHGHARPTARPSPLRPLSGGSDDRDAAAVLVAVKASRDLDGGYGWGLEPRPVPPREPAGRSAARPRGTHRRRTGGHHDPGSRAVHLAGGGHTGRRWAAVRPPGARLGRLCAVPGLRRPRGVVTPDSPRSWRRARTGSPHPTPPAPSTRRDRATACCLTAVRGPGAQPHAPELAFPARSLDAAVGTQPDEVESWSSTSRPMSRPTGWRPSPAGPRTTTCARWTSPRGPVVPHGACPPAGWSRGS